MSILHQAIVHMDQVIHHIRVILIVTLLQVRIRVLIVQAIVALAVLQVRVIKVYI